MKKQIRGEILKARVSLDRQQVNEKSKIICDKIQQFPGFLKSNTVMAYLPFRNEVDLTPLFDYLWDREKRVIIPVCEPKNVALIPAELRDMNEDLKPGTWGILEPKEEKMRPVDPQDIDFVIIPGVAFDPCCNRLGYGGGYYDRFLLRLKENTPKVAVAFDLQIVPSLVPGSYDIPMDAVITEKKEYYRREVTNISK
ncbi:MAG: 5-formyltetrahydrofolate cyclo-ligase [Dehalobacterium sp.]